MTEDSNTDTSTTHHVANDVANDDYVYYFAIGSMMHPGSCEMRHFYPQHSEPAELLDHRLHFFSAMGVAEAVQAPGQSMHGVLHRVTEAQMVELDNMEAGYMRSMAQAKTYGTTSSVVVAACVYCRPVGTDTLDTDQSPRQRYLEILLAGAQHWGVDAAYVQMLQDHPFRPRTKPEDFKSLGSPPDDCQVMEEVPDATDDDDDKTYFSLNGKIIALAYPKDHKMHNIFSFLRGKYGPHLEVGMAHALYDLKYGVPHTLDHFTKEHSGYIEDNFQVNLESGSHQYVQVIAKYPQTWKEEEE
jgi:hypothetical protein